LKHHAAHTTNALLIKIIPPPYSFFPFFATMAAKLINKGFNGWAQLGVFLGMWGVGLVAGSLVAAGVWSAMTGQGVMNMEQDMMNPKYATAVKMIQFVSTLFIFFIPSVAYAFICYKNGWLALGFRKNSMLKIIGISLLILIACLPMIDALSLLNKLIPIPAASKKYFDNIEKSYEEQVKVIGDVKTVGQYILSLFMIALLPAIFEETLFRGGLQNMLSRWKNNAFVYVVLSVLLLIAARSIWFKDLVNPWFFYGGILVLLLIIYRSQPLLNGLNRLTNHYLVPIIFVSILFSAVHASWYGFLPRVALGVLLGLLFYYTNNLTYNILLHFINNATVVTFMFYNARHDKPVVTAETPSFPWWAAFFSIVALILLFRWLRKTGRETQPGELFLNRDNPFNNTIFEENNSI
jgi:membrane protease YdiL (CAAX protease family)